VRETRLLLRGYSYSMKFKASHPFIDSHIAGVAELIHRDLCSGALAGQVTDCDIAMGILLETWLS